MDIHFEGKKKNHTPDAEKNTFSTRFSKPKTNKSSNWYIGRNKNAAVPLIAGRGRVYRQSKKTWHLRFKTLPLHVLLVTRKKENV